MSALPDVPDPRSANDRVSSSVRALMALRGMRIKDLAEITGIDEDTLGRRLRGAGKRQGWLVNEVAAVADVFEADIAKMFAGIDWFRRQKPTVLRREGAPHGADAKIIAFPHARRRG